MKYHLSYASGQKNIDRSETDDLNEARTMAKIMSRATDDRSSMVILVVDDELSIISIYHDGDEYSK